MSNELVSLSLISKYIEHCRVNKRLAENTVNIYSYELQRLTSFCIIESIQVDKIQPEQIKNWLGKLRNTNLKNSSLNLTISICRGFFSWMVRYDHVKVNPMIGIRAPQKAQLLPKTLTTKEAKHFCEMEVSNDDPWLIVRDKAIVELIYSSGLRVSEICSLDTHQHKSSKAWIDLDEALVFVIGKGNKERIVPIGKFCLIALREWLKVRNSKSNKSNSAGFALFLGQRGKRLTAQLIWQRIKRRGSLGGFEVPLHPHVLRHSFASHVLQSSQNIRAVQVLLGHASISTTQIYTKLDFAHLSNVYQKYHPRSKNVINEEQMNKLILELSKELGSEHLAFNESL